MIESEDHKTQNTFVINLGVADPADDSKDYTGVITPSAGSTQPNNGTDIDKAFDKKNDTFWHSSWNPSTTNENLYVTMELAEAQKIDAIRYLPKGGNLTGGDQNGRVKTYTVEVSMTGADDSWTKVEITPSTQEWANGTDWKIAQFVQPVEAKFIRFTGVETYGDGGQENKFMSAAEIRVKLAEDEPVVPEPKPTELVIQNQPTKTTYTEGEKFDPTGLVLTVKYDKGEDKEVAYGDATKADFTFSPSLDTALKTSDEKVTVTYAGKTAEIGIEVKADTPVEPEKPTVDKIAVKKVPAKTTYKVGEKFDPAGLVLTVTMSDGTTKVVAYGPETAKDFSFNPSLNTKLTADTKKVTVTYGGQSADVAVSVKADPSEDKKPVDPDKKPNTEKPDKGGAVQTGDNFNVTLLIGLVVLAGAVAGGAALTIFKRNKRK